MKFVQFRVCIHTYGEASKEVAIDFVYRLTSSFLAELGREDDLPARHLQCRQITLIPALPMLAAQEKTLKNLAKN